MFFDDEQMGGMTDGGAMPADDTQTGEDTGEETTEAGGSNPM